MTFHSQVNPSKMVGSQKKPVKVTTFGGTDGNDTLSYEAFTALYKPGFYTMDINGKGGLDTLVVPRDFEISSVTTTMKSGVNVTTLHLEKGTKGALGYYSLSVNLANIEKVSDDNVQYSLVNDGDVTRTNKSDKLGVLFSGAEMTGKGGADRFHLENISSLVSSNGFYEATITDFNALQGDKIVVNKIFQRSETFQAWTRLQADASGSLNLNFGEDAKVLIKGLTQGQSLKATDFAFA